MTSMMRCRRWTGHPRKALKPVASHCISSVILKLNSRTPVQSGAEACQHCLSTSFVWLRLTATTVTIPISLTHLYNYPVLKMLDLDSLPHP